MEVYGDPGQFVKSQKIVRDLLFLPIRILVSGRTIR